MNNKVRELRMLKIELMELKRFDLERKRNYMIQMKEYLKEKKSEENTNKNVKKLVLKKPFMGKMYVVS